MTAVSDFEKAIRLALMKVWPNIQCFGCYFHFCQAITRKADQLGLIPKRVNRNARDPRFIGIQLFKRLALLPLPRIDIGLEKCKEFLQINNLLASFLPFVDYFESTWIRRYPKDRWCVSERGRRTNNHVEGHNNALKIAIPLNPHAWVFVARLFELTINATATHDYEVANNTTPPPDRSKLTLSLNSALEKLNAGQMVEIEFLHLLAVP